LLLLVVCLLCVLLQQLLPYHHAGVLLCLPLHLKLYVRKVILSIHHSTAA
jgi:uncharacterized membrane protein